MKKFKTKKISIVVSVFTSITLVLAACSVFVTQPNLDGSGGGVSAVSVVRGIEEFDEVTGPKTLFGNNSRESGKDTGTATVNISPNNGGPICTGYRIPSITTVLAGKYKGQLFATIDARWGSTGDLPVRADTAGRRGSADATTWEDPVWVARWDVQTQGQPHTFPYFGDPSVGSDANGHLYAFANMGYRAAMQSNWSGKSALGSPYVRIDGEWYILLRANTDNDEGTWDPNDVGVKTIDNCDSNKKYGLAYKGSSTAGINETKHKDSKDINDFTYAAPVKGGKIVKIKRQSGSVPVIEPNFNSNLWMDKYYMLYTKYEKNKYKNPLKVARMRAGGTLEIINKNITDDNSPDLVDCHIMNPLSPFQPWNGRMYFAFTKSTDGGQTWTPPRDITYMTAPEEKNRMADQDDDDHFDFPTDWNPGIAVVSPTHPVPLRYDHDWTGRLIHTAYQASTGGNAYAWSFWTDDGGETWDCSNYIQYDGGTSQNNKGESAIVETPDGTLYMVNRHASGAQNDTTRFSYSESTDGGASWKDKGFCNSNDYFNYGDLFSPHRGGRVLPTAINLYKSVTPDGNPIVAFMHGKKVVLCSLEKKENDNTWTFNFKWNNGSGVTIDGLDYEQPNYCSITEMENGDIACFYEGNGSSTKFGIARLSRQ